MPSFAYAGTVPRAYPESRDEEGVIVGSVRYGDVRDLAEPLDADWFPAGKPLPVRLPPEPVTASEDTGSTGDEVKQPAPAARKAATTPDSGKKDEG